MNREKDCSTKSIWLYLLLITAFWVLSFVTLSFWLKPYSITYENTGQITMGYIAYALIGMLFTTPAPFISVFILAIFRARISPRAFFVKLLHTEKPLFTIALTTVFCLMALVFALLRGTPNGSPWYIMPLGFLVMVPFVGIAEEAVDMKLVQATKQDFQRITRFYRDVIARTEHMDTYARWIYGQHPTDEMIRRYIQANAMYYCEKDGSILSAVAVTQQGEEYHGAEWSASLEDDEVSVVHLLCVAPEWQGKGIARDTMGRIIELSREMGKRAVRLDALACNTPAHRLYASLGFQKRAQRRWYADNVGWTDFFLYEFIL